MISITLNGQPVQVSLVADLTDGGRITFQIDGVLVYAVLDYYNDVAAWHCCAGFQPGVAACDGRIDEDVNRPCQHIEAARPARAEQVNAEGLLRWHDLAGKVNSRAVAKGWKTAEEVAPTPTVLAAVATAADLLTALLHTAADDAHLAAIAAGEAEQAAAYDALAANSGYDYADLFAYAV